MNKWNSNNKSHRILDIGSQQTSCSVGKIGFLPIKFIFYHFLKGLTVHSWDGMQQLLSSYTTSQCFGAENRESKEELYGKH